MENQANTNNISDKREKYSNESNRNEAMRNRDTTHKITGKREIINEK